MDKESLVMLISERLNDSKFWVLLDRSLQRRGIKIDSEDLDEMAHDLEDQLATDLRNCINGEKTQW